MNIMDTSNFMPHGDRTDDVICQRVTADLPVTADLRGHRKTRQDIVETSYMCKGYDLPFVDSRMQRELICTRCHKVAKDPTVGSCGHIFCRDYIDKLKFAASLESNMSGEFLCVNSECRALQLTEMRQDKVKTKEISSLPVKCPNKGCEATVRLSQFVKHTKLECQHRKVQCTKCQKQINFNEQALHREKGCTHRNRCVLEPVGCTGSDHSRASHTLLELCVLEKLESKSMSVREMKQMTEERLDQAISISKLLAELRLPNLRDELTRNLNHNLNVCTTTRELAEEDEKILNQRYKNLAQLQSQLSRMSKEIDEMHSNTKIQSESINTNGTGIQGHHHMKTEGGVFIWRFENYSKKRTNALMGKDKRIISPPFLTHPNGYKFRLIVYPNGDGTGESQFISVFIAMQPTSYDDRLVYPLSAMIHISIINLRTQAPDHMMKFKTDLSPAAFQRPRNVPNPSTGLPRLLSISDLSNRDDYMPNDDLYFMVQVKPTDICKRPLHALELLDDGVDDSTNMLEGIKVELPEHPVAAVDDYRHDSGLMSLRSSE